MQSAGLPGEHGHSTLPAGWFLQPGAGFGGA